MKDATNDLIAELDSPELVKPLEEAASAKTATSGLPSVKALPLKPGMKVLDPFCGVTGMEAAARLGVDGFGIDIDPSYCNTAQDRLNKQSVGEPIT